MSTTYIGNITFDLHGPFSSFEHTIEIKQRQGQSSVAEYHRDFQELNIKAQSKEMVGTPFDFKAQSREGSWPLDADNSLPSLQISWIMSGIVLPGADKETSSKFLLLPAS